MIQANGAGMRLERGPGVRLRTLPGRTIVSFKGGNQRFIHPFQVSFSGSSAMLEAGLVNGVSATIKGVPLEGDAKKAAPRLTWKELQLDSTGRGWIAVEVTCGDDWEVKTAEVVQVGSLDSVDGKPPEGDALPYSAGASPGLPGRKARHPLAMLRQRSSGMVECFQVTHFNLLHRVWARDEKTDLVRHFFFPQG